LYLRGLPRLRKNRDIAPMQIFCDGNRCGESF
jgi:hypothetical protein